MTRLFVNTHTNQQASWLHTFGQTFSSITADSRQVQEDSLFIAYGGEKRDGRDYITQAIQAGASAVLWEADSFKWRPEWQVKNVSVPHLKDKVSEIAAEFYQYPAKKIPVIGVTGTNGKTTVSHWLAQCLSALGKKTAVIGTIGNGFIEAQTEAENTTPDAIKLQAMLAEYVQQSAQAVAMEVSSHGLKQGRVNGVQFSAAVFTNLTPDHLDYHDGMDDYKAAKRRLFDWPNLNVAIVNADDAALGASMVRELAAKGQRLMSYGMQPSKAATHVQGLDLQLREHGLRMQVTTPQGCAAIDAKVLGEFNAYNLLAVLATLLALDVPLKDAIAVIENVRSVAGRMQQLGGGALPLVVIDYAHTADALDKVLLTLRAQIDQIQVGQTNRQAQAKAKLWCVFGCGGERYQEKRPEMGKVAAKYADQIIVTSDNPRSEDPQAIIDQIVAGIETDYRIEADRARAIYQAIHAAKPSDIVLIAGKGHEDYQEIAGVKHAFSDVLFAEQALASYLELQP